MVKVIIVEKVLKNGKTGKNPACLYDFNFLSRGVLDLPPESVRDIQEGFYDTDIVQRINDEMGVCGATVQLQINSKKQHGGMIKIAEWEV
jgi:hypothetical protein